MYTFDGHRFTPVITELAERGLLGTGIVLHPAACVLWRGIMEIPSENEFPQGPEIESIAPRLGDAGQR